MSFSLERQKLIHEAFLGNQDHNSAACREAVADCLELLDSGKLRVMEKVDGEWRLNTWAKEAILLSFRSLEMKSIQAGDLSFYDKIPVKKWSAKEGVRVVPHAVVRKGAFVERGAILMPSYVNIGAFVGEGSMVDTWATVGSCAQIGKRVHLSGGVGIGGVLEPVQAQPVIVEDEAFLGSRSIVVEGVHIEARAVLGAGVVLTASTRIVDVTGAKEKEWKGRVPEAAVVIPGFRQKKFPAGEYGVPVALIIGYRSSSTDQKTSLTAALRDFDISV
ncbi:MAG: 2,3,4,5-tetrahydropyridine-2,6-dicarboxylate N-succinyltransferase [Bradymonadales bacterium]|nr:MAG: 2,3,4,5-tetrahydropyridine-2,6-dicarboxylate N-succinyltransferase [Bradymonadales bacterium]